MNSGQGTLPWQPILWRDTTKSWHTLPLLFVLAFYNGWEYRNADYGVNIHDDSSSTSAKNFVNFGPITREILLLICIGGWVHVWPKYAVSCIFARWQ